MKLNRNAKITLLIFLLGAIVLAVIIFIRRDTTLKEGQYTVGEYRVQAKVADSQGSDGLTNCDISITYKNQKIPIGTYPQKGTCQMEQTPTLSNGMLAVITQAYVFLYDPKTGEIHKLDPFSTPGFS